MYGGRCHSMASLEDSLDCHSQILYMDREEAPSCSLPRTIEEHSDMEVNSELDSPGIDISHDGSDHAFHLQETAATV